MGVKIEKALDSDINKTLFMLMLSLMRSLMNVGMHGTLKKASNYRLHTLMRKKREIVLAENQKGTRKKFTASKSTKVLGH